MSKTFKTDPYWVKVRRGDKAVSEHHDHRHGICDFNELHGRQIFWRHTTYCGYDVSYYGYHAGFYPRPPRRAAEATKEIEGSTRAYWRKAKHDLMKLDAEGIEDYDVISNQHRHSALWDIQ